MPGIARIPDIHSPKRARVERVNTFEVRWTGVHSKMEVLSLPRRRVRGLTQRLTPYESRQPVSEIVPNQVPVSTRCRNRHSQKLDVCGVRLKESHFDTGTLGIIDRLVPAE